jgi:hypothetical protein
MSQTRRGFFQGLLNRFTRKTDENCEDLEKKQNNLMTIAKNSPQDEKEEKRRIARNAIKQTTQCFWNRSTRRKNLNDKDYDLFKYFHQQNQFKPFNPTTAAYRLVYLYNWTKGKVPIEELFQFAGKHELLHDVVNEMGQLLLGKRNGEICYNYFLNLFGEVDSAFAKNIAKKLLKVSIEGLKNFLQRGNKIVLPLVLEAIRKEAERNPKARKRYDFLMQQLGEAIPDFAAADVKPIQPENAEPQTIVSESNSGHDETLSGQNALLRRRAISAALSEDPKEFAEVGVQPIYEDESEKPRKLKETFSPEFVAAYSEEYDKYEATFQAVQNLCLNSQITDEEIINELQHLPVEHLKRIMKDSRLTAFRQKQNRVFHFIDILLRDANEATQRPKESKESALVSARHFATFQSGKSESADKLAELASEIAKRRRAAAQQPASEEPTAAAVTESPVAAEDILPTAVSEEPIAGAAGVQRAATQPAGPDIVNYGALQRAADARAQLQEETIPSSASGQTSLALNARVAAEQRDDPDGPKRRKTQLRQENAERVAAAGKYVPPPSVQQKTTLPRGFGSLRSTSGFENSLLQPLSEKLSYANKGAAEPEVASNPNPRLVLSSDPAKKFYVPNIINEKVLRDLSLATSSQQKSFNPSMIGPPNRGGKRTKRRRNKTTRRKKNTRITTKKRRA